VFDLDYFREKPKAFLTLAKEMWPGIRYQPTFAHRAMKSMHDKGYLQRIYTQNIDTLERVAGVPGELLVEAHGSFSGATCIDCRAGNTTEWVRDQIMVDREPRCDCGGLVKPNIVFFGENLPSLFFDAQSEDFGFMKGPDLMVIAGTSLQVQPFASLQNAGGCPRVLINREIPETFHKNAEDVVLLGDADDGFAALASALGLEVPPAEVASAKL